MSYVTSFKKTFPGGETTASILDEGVGRYRVTVITRFDSGNYLKERDERFGGWDEALKFAEFYAR